MGIAATNRNIIWGLDRNGDIYKNRNAQEPDRERLKSAWEKQTITIGKCVKIQAINNWLYVINEHGSVLHQFVNWRGDLTAGWQRFFVDETSNETRRNMACIAVQKIFRAQLPPSPTSPFSDTRPTA